MAEYLSPAVYIEEVSSGNKPIQAASTSTGAFVGITEKGPIGDAVPIQNFTEFSQTFGTYIADGDLAFAIKGFFDEGGSSCYVVRTAHYTDPADTTTLQAVTASGTYPAVGAGNALRVDAFSPGAWGNQVAVEFGHSGTDRFFMVVSDKGVEVERHEDLTMDATNPNYVGAVIELGSSYVTVADLAGATTSFDQARPAVMATEFLPDATVAATTGADGLGSLASADFVGDSAGGTGLHAFDKVEGIRIVAMPDAFPESHSGGMAYCAARADCFYIADAPEGADTADEALHYKTAQGAFSTMNALNSKYGALYAPYVDVFDPRSGRTHRIPPSGLVAGRFAATDASRGVHKAAAGTEDGRLRSALGLAAKFTAVDQEKLNPKGICVIRSLHGVGNAIWGARTVSSDPEWTYLNVRRLFLFLETSIKQSTNWIVFEPNDEALWKSIVRNVSAFLKLQWLAGALVGSTPEEAFYVRCDNETNPQESIDVGRVITEIGVAPSKPAEFVVFRISQSAPGSGQ